jgi:hypothetical protein
MQLIRRGTTRPLLVGGRRIVRQTVTIDCAPMSVPAFRQLLTSVIGDKTLVDVRLTAEMYAVVTLTSVEDTKNYLVESGKLPGFAKILPDK